MVTLKDTLFKIKERQRCTPILFQFNHVLEVIANEKLNKNKAQRGRNRRAIICSKSRNNLQNFTINKGV